ncbi:T-cell surface glycoprotein CD3 gamma chain-like isoform X2 [Pseudophryne corroboree]|uniref:T-cell surface glycoprotein CD3 gamma chain-like isoform X2 n=1 Tax=Pseudophryne corroboree TaxID=495146 RepID=UPI003081DDFE
MAYPAIALCCLAYICLHTGTSAQDADVTSNPEPIKPYEKNEKLFLHCSFNQYSWKKDDSDLGLEFNNTDLDLGSLWNDPRGVYSCWDAAPDPRAPQYIHVHVRKCQNCIELDTGTISGFLVADVIMIGLIAMAVYFVSGVETRRPGRASDKQNLIENDGAYQALGPRNEDPYSQPAPRMKTGAF